MVLIIFANNDLDLMTKLIELVDHGFCHWKLEGLYTPGHNFVEIAKDFCRGKGFELKQASLAQIKPLCWMRRFTNCIRKIVFSIPDFYDYDPDMVK